MNSFEATSIFELTPDWDRKGPDSCPRNADDRLDVSVLCTKMPATANELEVAAELAIARAKASRRGPICIGISSRISSATGFSETPTVGSRHSRNISAILCPMAPMPMTIT